MKKRLGLLMFLCVGLLGCFPNLEDNADENKLAATVPVTRAVVEENPTAVPVVRPSPTFESEVVDGSSSWPIYLISPDNVSCGDLKDGIEEKSYWVDDFIPGESTYDEALQVIDELPEEKKPILLSGEAGFSSSDSEVNYLLLFEKGVLKTKEDPRLYLGEIISHYGDPVQVSWEVHFRSATTGPGEPVEAVDTTALFFPQSNAVFWAEGQITYFSADTIFEGIVLTPFLYEEFYAETNSKVSSSKEFVQHFPWPCD